MLISTAHFPTAKGSQYLQQLCKHFAHKVPVDYDTHQGSATLSTGSAHLVASESGLDVRVEAEDAKGLIQARFAVDKHLVNFAFRENFAGFAWSDPYA